VVRICRDLGLSPDWNRWAREAWACEAGAVDEAAGEAATTYAAAMVTAGAGPPMELAAHAASP
jgi:hypothetical protein